MRKGTVFAVLALMTTCLLPMSFGLARETSNLGTINLPITAEFSVAQEAKPSQVTKSQDEVVAEIMAR